MYCSVICCVLFTDKREKDLMIEKRYSIENVIGNGGFGTVYAGRRKKDGFAVCTSNSVQFFWLNVKCIDKRLE